MLLIMLVLAILMWLVIWPVHIEHQIVKVGLDFDATLWDSMRVWREYTGNELFTYASCENYSDPVQWAGGHEPFTQLLKETQTYEAMTRFQPLPHAIAVLRRLRRRFWLRPLVGLRPWGVTVRLVTIHFVVITARSLESERQAVWRILLRHGLTPQAVVSASGTDKIRYCLQANIAIHAEDEPSTLRYAYEAGLPVCGLLYPYNQEALLKHNIPHAADWLGLEYLLHTLVYAHLRHRP
ncbi:MAG TPA: hypothetical protein VLI05_00100 [Candidatus Saccharimonadia bacterium]|nr:hypothetical protein [Candidatus Saccharimonadia bacterium]